MTTSYKRVGAKWEETLTALPVGNSFFVPDKRPTDKTIVQIRNIAYRLGIKLKIWRVHNDEIYQAAGTRIRREEGPPLKRGPKTTTV